MKPLTHDELEALKAMAAAAMKGEVSGGEALPIMPERSCIVNTLRLFSATLPAQA